MKKNKVTVFTPFQTKKDDNDTILEEFKKYLQDSKYPQIEKEQYYYYAELYVKSFLTNSHPTKTIYDAFQFDILSEFLKGSNFENDTDKNMCRLGFIELYTFMEKSKRMPKIDVNEMTQRYINKLDADKIRKEKIDQIDDFIKQNLDTILKHGVDVEVLKQKVYDPIYKYTDEEILDLYNQDDEFDYDEDFDEDFCIDPEEKRQKLLQLTKNAKKLPKQLYQIKVSLEDSKPHIWRSFVVDANITLDKLNDCLQILMGWDDSHLYEFSIRNLSYGKIYNYDDDNVLIDQSNIILRAFDFKVGDAFEYTYDFGDDWHHILRIEKILTPDKDSLAPICLAGERNFLLEDIGGIYEYNKIVKLMKNPAKFKNSEYAEYIDKDYNPEEFKLDEINLRLKPKKIK